MQPSEQIKEKIDIADFIKNYVELKPAGRNFKGLCPFHNERSPSFMVSKERQIWHCFGCSKGGDVFKFLMEYENLEFREALKILAEKAGIELRKMSPEDYRQFGVLYDISEAAKSFYLESAKKFPIAYEYLKKRGLSDATIEEFEIGFAPNEFDRTTTQLIQKGFKVDDIVRAGVAFRSDSGKIGDRFRGRIMFPIHDHSGKVVGFSGRILPELEGKTDMGKYVNSPETPIFNKSKTMYGFWASKRAIRDSKTALLVEGQMDFLMTYQSGVKNVVATSGTALTAEHLKTLKPIAEKIIISFDNDSAGVMAIERSIDLMSEHDFSVSILDLGEYKDPADAAAADPNFLPQAIRSTKSAIEFYFDRYLKDDLVKEKKNIRAVLAKIKKIYSPIERANWLRELAYKTSLTEKDLRDEMDKIELESDSKSSAAKPNYSSKSKEPRSEAIALRILQIALNREDLRSREDLSEFLPPNYANALQLVKNPQINWKELDEEIGGKINELTLLASLEEGRDRTEQDVEFEKLISELQTEFYRDKIKNLQQEIASAEKKGDDEGLALVLRKFDDMAKKMQNIKNKAFKPQAKQKSA